MRAGHLALRSRHVPGAAPTSCRSRGGDMTDTTADLWRLSAVGGGQLRRGPQGKASGKRPPTIRGRSRRCEPDDPSGPCVLGEGDGPTCPRRSPVPSTGRGAPAPCPAAGSGSPDSRAAGEAHPVRRPPRTVIRSRPGAPRAPSTGSFGPRRVCTRALRDTRRSIRGSRRLTGFAVSSLAGSTSAA